MAVSLQAKGEKLRKNVYSTNFFLRPTEEVARDLLGAILLHETEEGVTAGMIVETEAYLSCNDPACHAACGMTKRNAPMFGKPGTVYVYKIYGMHCCFNVVTGPEGRGEAVLVRALEPIAGIELMQKRRGKKDLRDLCSGPAKLVEAMGITLDLNGASLMEGPLYLLRRRRRPQAIVTTTRVGISKGADLPLRFYIAGNPYVSVK